MNIGKVLKQLRMDARHYNMREFCRENKLDQSHLSAAEVGSRPITMTYVKKLAEIYGIPVGIIFFMALEESDIKDESKVAAFKAIKPSMDKLLNETFLIRI